MNATDARAIECSPIESGSALYVALTLPTDWDIVTREIATILSDEFGCRLALEHPPHITIHPPFFPSCSLAQVVESLRESLRRTPLSEIEALDVLGFGGDPPTQIVLTFDRGWCVAAHQALLDGVAPCTRPSLRLSNVWPPEHQREGFIPHTSLAVGDLPSGGAERRAMLDRARAVYDSVRTWLRPPPRFLPQRVQVVAYDPFPSLAVPRHAPAVIATVIVGDGGYGSSTSGGT